MPYKDKDKQREYQREWSKRKFSEGDNKEKRKQGRRTWRGQNKERLLLYEKQWKATPKGLISRRETMRRYYATRRIENRERCRRIKRERGCSMCPETHPAALDFHHLDRSTKNKNIAAMVGHEAPWELIAAEIDKCIVLCSNCHRKLHDEGV